MFVVLCLTNWYCSFWWQIITDCLFIFYLYTHPRLLGQNCNFFTTLLSRNSQKKLEHKENQTKYRNMTRKTRSHVRMFVYKRGLLPQLGLDCKLAPVHYGKKKVVNCLGTSSLCSRMWRRCYEVVRRPMRLRPKAEATRGEASSKDKTSARVTITTWPKPENAHVKSLAPRVYRRRKLSAQLTSEPSNSYG